MDLNRLREQIFGALKQLFSATGTDAERIRGSLFCQTGASKQTINKLISKGAKSLKGELLVKLTFFFLEEGYKGIDLQVDPLLKAFGRAIYTGRINWQEAGKIAGYNRTRDLMVPLLGEHQMSRKQREKVERWLKSDTSKLLEVSEAKGISKTIANPVIQPLAALLQATSPLIKFLLSDKSTPEDRATLRQILNGDDSLFNLTNILSGLCSETARREMKKETDNV